MNKMLPVAVLLAALAATAAPASAQSAPAPGAPRARPPLTANLPYSATETTTKYQLLADGNRSASVAVARVYRDSIGRTRKDKLDDDGAIVSTTITDGDGVQYLLDPRRETVTRQALMLVSGTGENTKVRFAGNLTPAKQEQLREGVMAGRRGERERSAKSLGERDFDGVTATGHENRAQYPTDAAGGTVEVVSESWYSQDLRVMVSYKLDDPRRDS
jgi:hypothetical protein